MTRRADAARHGGASFVSTFGANVLVSVDVDVQHHGVAADGAILDEVLMVARRDIDRHDDLLAAGITHVGGFEVSGATAGMTTPAGDVGG